LTLFLKIDDPAPSKRNYSIILKEIFHFPALTPTGLEFCNAVAKSSIMAFIVISADIINIVNIGVFFTVQAITIFIFRPIVSRLADKIGTLKLLIPFEIAAIAAIMSVSRADNLAVFLVGAFFMGFSLAGHEPIIMAECAKIVEVKKRGAANNTLFLGINLGNFFRELFSRLFGCRCWLQANVFNYGDSSFIV
jgi:MFS family permease